MRLNISQIVILAFSLLWLMGCSITNGKEVSIGESNFPPKMYGRINVNGTDYEMDAGNYRWEQKNGLNTQVVTTDSASPFQMANHINPIQIKPNEKVIINIEESPQLNVYLWNVNGRDKAVTLNSNELIAPSNKGRYIYEVLANWPNGEVSYTFVLEIN